MSPRQLCGECIGGLLLCLAYVGCVQVLLQLWLQPQDTREHTHS